MSTGTTMNLRACALAAALLGLMSGCGGGGGGGGAGTGPTAPVVAPPVVAPVVQHTVGGTVEGLAPDAVVTLSQGSDKLTVGNGPFAFGTKLDAGASFTITATAPGGHTCKVSDGTGAVSSANAAKSVVACAPVLLAGVKNVFQQPVSVASDTAGNLYVFDRGQQSLFKLVPGGSPELLAGGGKPGYADGSGSNARFRLAYLDGDVVADSQGNLLVADSANGVIRKVSPAGVVTTLAGSRELQGSADGTGAAASFTRLDKMEPDGAGGAIVLDSYNGATLRMVSATGVVTTKTWTNPDASAPSGFGFRTIARSSGDGTLFVSDGKYRIWKDVGGTLVLLAGGRGSYDATSDGTGAGARFEAITDMVAMPNGDLYVADATAIRKVTPAGVVTTLAGNTRARGVVDGVGGAARFGLLESLAFDGTSLVVIDGDGGILRRVGLDGTVTTLDATPMVRGNTDGRGAAARISGVQTLSADADGDLYFVNPGTHVVRKTRPDGTVSTIGGTPGVRGTTDGPLATALFSNPHTVATGRDGTLWVAQDSGLRKIQNGTVTTVAQSMFIADMTADADGNAIVTDATSHITRISPTGEKTVLVTDNDIAALLGVTYHSPEMFALVTDAAGNLYFTDSGSAVVYKRTKAGELSVFAGTLMQSGDADGPPGTATLYLADAVYMTIDDKGNLYLSSQGNLRMISPTGVISTPTLGWGKQAINAIAFAKGRLHGMTKYALLQTYLP